MLHLRPAQVDVAVFQFDVIVHMVVVKLERGRAGLVQDFNRVAEDLAVAQIDKYYTAMVATTMYPTTK